MEVYRRRVYDAVYGFKDYAGEAERLRALIQERLPEARSLLDVACGTGKHLEQLRRRYEVAGVDLDPEQAALARERLPGLEITVADMVELDLGRRFDVVTCLFSSIGYVRSEERLRRALARLAAHLETPGLLVVEPWLTPDVYRERHVGALFVDEPELKLARMNTAGRRGSLSVMDFHYLLATPDGIERWEERHELGLFSDEQYRGALVAAGLDVEHDPEGLIGRGLYLGLRR